MRLSSDQMYQYERDGFLVLESLFSDSEVEALRAAFEADARIPGPQRVLEDGSERVRAVYGSHERQPEYADLICTPRLLEPVRALLSESVYLYQMKINAKPAFGGDKWGWHQDYLAWRLADQLPAPKLINVAVLLDEATEFNGPLIMVPGSHASGLLRDDRTDEHRSDQHLDPDDIALGQEELAALAAKHGFHSVKAAAGSAVFFHPEIVHGSAPNMSPFPRRLFIATYNDTGNLPMTPEPRPVYLVGRDVTPLEPAGAAR